VGNRVAPVSSKVAMSNLDAGRRLPALVFGQMQQPFDARNDGRVNPLFGQIGGRLLIFHQPDQNAVKQVIGRQAVFVLLVGAQLCRRRPRDGPLRG